MSGLVDRLRAFGYCERETRDEAAAGVPFHFKQIGEWG